MSVQLGVKALEIKVARLDNSEILRLEQFLSVNAYLVPLADEALRRLKVYFPEATMRLCVQDDADSDDMENLVCFVVTKQTVEEAEAAYDQFREAWWLDKKELAEGRFTICVEYT